MRIEKEKCPKICTFDSIGNGEVFVLNNNPNEYYMKLKFMVYSENGEDGFQYEAIRLSDGDPVTVYFNEKCIIKSTAKIIFTED